MVNQKKTQEGVFIALFALSTLVAISLAVSFMSTMVTDLLAGQGQVMAGKQSYWLAYSGMEMNSTNRFAEITAGTNIYTLEEGTITTVSTTSADKFNGANRTNVITSTGTVADGSRQSKWTLVDPSNKAMDFDGSGDYIDVPDDATLDFAEGAFSYAAWFRPAELKAQQVLGKRNPAGDANYELELADDGTITAKTGGSSFTATSTYAINNWYHVVYTRNALGVCKLYVNGSYETTANHAGNVDNTIVLRIGGDFDGSSSTLDFNGIIDNVSIWNTELTLAHVRTLYIQNKDFDITNLSGVGLVSHWNFDDETATDQQGNNHGTITNASATGV